MSYKNLLHKMNGTYDITFKLAYPIKKSLMETGLKGNISTVGFIAEIVSPTQIEANKDGGYIQLGNFFVGIKPKVASDGLETIRYALETAKILEAATSSSDTPLKLNPNIVQVALSTPEKDHLRIEESEARGLQKGLYLDGSGAYYNSSGDYKLILGIQNQFPHGVEILEAEGTAQPADSLDELLARIEKANTQ